MEKPGLRIYNRPMKPRLSQAGSALFIILVAVVLFAALAYAVANMMRGGSPETLSEDTIKLYTTEVLDYARVMRETVQTMRIANGCGETDISFENNTLPAYNYNPPQGNRCKVFHNAGGDLAFISAAEDWLANTAENWRFLGRNCVENIGSGSGNCHSDGDSGNEDLILALGGLKKQLCISINEKLGVTNPSGNPPAVASINTTAFTGSFADGNILASAGTNYLDSKMSGCFESGGAYYFYNVLVAR